MHHITKIKLDNVSDESLKFIKDIIVNHIQDVEIIDENKTSDIEISLPDTMVKPYRMGGIIDHIEKTLFDHNYNIDVIYKHYHLNIRDNILNIDGQSFPLSARETDLCAYLLRSGDRGCGRELLLNNVWGYRADLETHALETQIYRLRQKIEHHPDDPQNIVTFEGGYKFA